MRAARREPATEALARPGGLRVLPWPPASASAAAGGGRGCRPAQGIVGHPFTSTKARGGFSGTRTIYSFHGVGANESTSTPRLPSPLQ